MITKEKFEDFKNNDFSMLPMVREVASPDDNPLSLFEKISDKKIQLCSIKIDKKNPRKEITVSLVEEQYENKSVVIVDDVLNSGSTLMYAVKYFLDTKLNKLKTAVLVDRNHKKYPIKADYKGLSLSTSIQNHVEVSINDNEINAYLV